MVGESDLGKSRIEGVFESILRRASYDRAFRALALTDVDALMSKYGIKLASGSQIKFVEVAQDADEDSIVLPPMIKISLEESDLKVTVGQRELSLARYENWSSDRINKLFSGVAAENWGSE